jgi:hypothetical protein
MEVDLVVTPKLQPTKSKVVSGTMILSGVIDGFDEVEEGTLIPAQLEPIVIPATTTPNLVVANENPRVDIRVEDIEATIMEE